MKELLSGIGWHDLYPETLSRLEYFKSNFRQIYSTDIISDEDLDKCVVYTFGIYGQGHIYNIYSALKNHQLEDTNFQDYFNSFTDAFKCLPESTYSVIKPKQYINLFIEYIFSLVLKGTYVNHSL
jgi:hypothetical protein